MHAFHSSPRLIHHRRLVEALLLQDFDGLLTGDSGQDGEWGGKVQTLQLQVPPPDRQRQTSSTTERGTFPACTTPFLWHVPWLVYHDVLLTQEALLDHPLVTQELGPRGGKRSVTEPTSRSEFKLSHFTTKELSAQNQKFPSFSHVVTDGVGQDDHTALALLQLLGDIYCRSHGCPRAAACDRAEQTVSVLQAHI